MPVDPDPSADTIAATPDTDPEPATSGTHPPGGPPRGPSIPGPRYALGAVIGRGGMGEVLSATDRQLGREVAVKRMRTVASEDAVARFMREAQVQGRLDHPAIVPVHELARDTAGRPYFVMKRLAGTTLAEHLAGVSPCPRPRMLGAFVDVCFAVEFAHRRGIVHRDLKPANIMLGEFREVYVLDWGVARILGEADPVVAPPGDDITRSGSTQIGTVLGTPGYIAPEQLRGEPVDARADVYALGCILFEILCGTPLFARDEALTGPLEPVDARPSRRADDVPPELDALCVAATALDPAGRLASAGALGDAVQRYLDGDRDLALRRERAAAHLAAAEAALARGDSAATRAEAMREAGRALALHPEDERAGRLIGRLMLAPPAETPPEVEADLTRHAEEVVRANVKIDRIALVSYLSVTPFFVVMGVRDWVHIAAAGVALLALAAATWFVLAAPSARLRLAVWSAALANALLIAVYGRIATPFLIAPALAAGTIMVFSLHIRWTRPGPLVVLFTLAVLGPVILEHAGILAPTMTTLGDEALVLTSPAILMRMPWTEVFLAVYVVLLLATCSYITRRTADIEAAARRQLQVQTWHLEQLAGLAPRARG